MSHQLSHMTPESEIIPVHARAPASWKYTAARLHSWVNRFRLLPRAERLFRHCPHPTFIKRPLFGYEMWLDVSRTNLQRLLYLEGEHFIRERHLLSRLVTPGMRVVDVGANIGYYLLLFESLVGRLGEVLCVEPSPENLPELRANIDANSFSNVRLLEAAIGRERGKAPLREGINSGISIPGGGKYEVDVQTLDELCTERVDFIKIDVEGYEGHVLEGAMQLLERYRPILFLEFHPHLVGQFECSLREIVDRLKVIYNHITYFEKYTPRRLVWVNKLATRYLPRDATVKIANLEQLFAVCESGMRQQTFWLICQS